MSITVILRENVAKLGRIGDVVKVSPGYARNFLIPKNLVMVADESNIQVIEHHKKALEKKRIAQRASHEEVAKKMSEFSCTITRKVGEGDKLFGSVTAHDITEALKKGGFTVAKGEVQLDAPIKSLGVHPVTVKLDHDVSASIKVWVAKEE